MTKLRPPPVAVKHAITEAVWEYTTKINEKADTRPDEYFPTGWHKIVEAAIDKAFDNYNSSELGKIEVELDRIKNAFKQ